MRRPFVLSSNKELATKLPGKVKIKRLNSLLKIPPKEFLLIVTYKASTGKYRYIRLNIKPNFEKFIFFANQLTEVY